MKLAEKRSIKKRKKLQYKIPKNSLEHCTTKVLGIWEAVGSRPSARIAWLGGERNKFGGSTRSLFCVNSWGVRGHEKFIPVWIKWTRWGAKIQRDFPAENRWSPKKKRSSLKLQGIFRQKSEIQAVFPAENRWSPKNKIKKKGLHWNCRGFFGRKQVISKKMSQKRHKIWCPCTKNII